MSAPDFDPDIERAYRVTPEFADSALFDAEVEVRLENRWRWRRGLMGAMVLAGVFVAFSQLVTFRFKGVMEDGVLNAVIPQSQRSEAFGQVKNLADQLGLADVSYAGLSGPYLVVILGVVASVALVGMAVRLSNSL